MRAISAITAATSSTSFMAATRFSSQPRSSSRSGAYGEVGVCFIQRVRRVVCSTKSLRRREKLRRRSCGLRLAWLPTRAPSRASKINALDDQGELGGLHVADGKPAIGGKSGTKTASFEPFRPHREAVAIPVHDAHAVATFGKENEQVAAQWVELQHVTHEHHQAIGALASVHRLRRNEQPHARRQAQHSVAPSSISTSRLSAPASNESGTNSTCPVRSTSSIRDGRCDRTSTNAARSGILAALAASCWPLLRPSRSRQLYSRAGSIPSRSANPRTVSPDEACFSRTARA